MDADTSWYEEGRNHFKNQPSTSGTQRGRPPDKEQKPDIKDKSIINEDVCLIDDEDEAVNAFHNTTRKKILLPFTGVEIQEELQFLEAIKQFKMILEEKVEVLTFRTNPKEFLYKYLLFFGSNYGRIAILYKEQYLDVMEDILLYYCDIIKEFFRDQKRRNKKMRVIQEARRMKILLKHCMLNKMDRILHVLLKVRLSPDLKECRLLWGDVYVFFLTKVKFTHTEDDILRSFIAFQKFKTLRTKSEAPIIDKLMYSIYKITTEELRKIPCLDEIIDRMKRDRLYSPRDMVARYIRYYKEKIRHSEPFEMDGFDEDTEESNLNGLRRLNLSSSFAPTGCSTDSSSADRRRGGGRKTILDLAAESIYQQDQCTNNEFALFDEDLDLTKKEPVEDEIVILDDKEDDDVIVVWDNLKTVITIDDDDDEEPVQIQPTKSPPPREALSPDKIPQPTESQVSTSNSRPVEIQPPIGAELTSTSPTSQSHPLDPMEVDNSLPMTSPITMEHPVPDPILPPLKEPFGFSKTPIPPENLKVLVPKKINMHTSTRQVTRVDNSLKITINSFPKKVNLTPASQEGNNEKMETQQISPSECKLQSSVVETEKTIPPVVETEVIPSATASVTQPVSLDKEMEESSHHIVQTTESGLNERLLPKATLIASSLDNVSSEEAAANQPMEVQEVGSERNQVPDQSALDEHLPPEKSSPDSKGPSNQSSDDANAMKKIASSSSDNNFETLEKSVANSTMNEEFTPSIIMASSLSPIVKEHSTRTDRVENCCNAIMKVPSAVRRGVLPSSKVPSDLDDSPDKDTDKYVTRRRSGPRTESETSNISSPSFESIDRTDVKKYFDGRRLPKDGVVSSLSSSETDTTCSSSTSSNTTTTTSSTSTYEPTTSLHVTAESPAANTAETAAQVVSNDTSSTSEPSDTSSFEQSCEITQETTVIQVMEPNLTDQSHSDDSKSDKESTKSSEIKTLQPRKEPESFTPETLQIAASGVASCDLAQKSHGNSNNPRNYSNITECFTKFTDELSSEDILTSHTGDLVSSAENLALTTIDLVPSTEMASDVIMVKHPPIEPLKDEENIVSASETITFSTEEVQAVLVTCPGSSQEESQHFLMCLSDKQLAFSDDNMTPAINNTPDDQNLAKTLVDTNRSMPPQHRRETVEGLSLSGSQPYTPQSSPSTRIETVRQDINRFDDGSSILDPYLSCSVTTLTTATPHPIISPPRQEPTVINRANHLKEGQQPLEKVSKITSSATKRRNSTDISHKPCRKSSDLFKDVVPQLVAETKISRNCGTTEKIPENAVEGFREDLSQSLTCARRVTPQEVDKITQLPLKYSQPLWTDKPQADLYKKQFDVEPPAATKVLQQITNTSNHNQQSTGDSLHISHPNLSEKSVSLALTPDTSLASTQDKQQLNDMTCSASFAEEKLNELYIKEFGSNNLSQPKMQSSTRRDSREGRSVKIYAKEKSIKGSSQPKDVSLKSYKTLIKGVSKRRTSVLRDIETPFQNEEGSQLLSRNPKVTEEVISQLPKDLGDLDKGSYSRETTTNAYDRELFNNGIEGPVGKPLMRAADVDNNFFWDSDNDASMEGTYSGTISVKPDCQLYQAEKQGTAGAVVSSQKNSSAPSLKTSSRTKGEKSPEKKRSLAASTKLPVGLYVKLTSIDIESYQQDLKRKLAQARELKKKKQRQIALAQEMREKQQQSLQRDQILLRIYSEKSEPNNNWFANAKAKLSHSRSKAATSSTYHHVSSGKDHSSINSTTKGKSKDQPVPRNNGQKMTEKRINREDFEPEDGKVPRTKIALRIFKKATSPIPARKVVTTRKLKSIIKSVEMHHHPTSSRGVGTDGGRDEGPSSPIKTTKSGRACKRPRHDYEDVIKSGSSAFKKPRHDYEDVIKNDSASKKPIRDYDDDDVTKSGNFNRKVNKRTVRFEL